MEKKYLKLQLSFQLCYGGLVVMLAEQKRWKKRQERGEKNNGYEP